MQIQNLPDALLGGFPDAGLSCFSFREHLTAQGVTSESAMRRYMGMAYDCLKRDHVFDLRQVRVDKSNPNLLPMD